MPPFLSSSCKEKVYSFYSFYSPSVMVELVSDDHITFGTHRWFNMPIFFEDLFVNFKLSCMNTKNLHNCPPYDVQRTSCLKNHRYHPASKCFLKLMLNTERYREFFLSQQCFNKFIYLI